MSVASFLSNLETLGYKAAGKFPDKDLAKLEEIAALVAQNGAITLSGKQLTRESSEIYRPMARAYKQIMAELPPSKSVADAHIDFIRGMKENGVFGKGAEVSVNQRAFTKFLADETVIAERQAERAINGAPKSGLREEVTLTRLEQKALDAAKAKAESNISSSLDKMSNIKSNNGKLPEGTFFGDLQDSLRTKGLLVVRREGAVATTPEKIFERIAAREVVSESEMRTLSNYFSRYHNEAGAAVETAQSGGTVISQKGGWASLVEMAAKRLTPEPKMDPTLAQRYAWTHREGSAIVDQVSRYQQKPVASLGKVAATGFVAYSALSIGMTLAEPEEPWYLGQKSMAVIATDKLKDVDDYIEFSADRYNSNGTKAAESLKKYYGVEFGKNTKEEIVTALSGPVKPPYSNEMAATVTPSLILYASVKLGLGPVATAPTMMAAYNDQLNKDADKDKALAGQKEQSIADLKQAARTAGAPEDLLDGLAGGSNKKGTPQSSGETLHEATSFASTLTGDVFKQRLDSMKQEGLLSDELHSKLASAFKGATKAPVSDDQEFTRANVAKGSEISSFAKNATEILSQNRAIPKSAINQAVYELLAPAAP